MDDIKTVQALVEPTVTLPRRIVQGALDAINYGDKAAWAMNLEGVKEELERALIAQMQRDAVQQTWEDVSDQLVAAILRFAWKREPTLVEITKAAKFAAPHPEAQQDDHAGSPAPSEPVAEWQWRQWWNGDGGEPQGWGEWQRVTPRNRLQTLSEAVQEFRDFIAQGCRYELRPLYAHPAPSALPLFAVGVAQRKWESLQADGYRMQRIEFARSIEGQEKRGTIDPWGKVLWPAPSAQSSKAALSDEIRTALELAVRQNEHDMLMTGDELRHCRAILARAGITPQAGKESGE